MPSPVRFAVIRSMLETHGWVLVRIKGSHHSFRKMAMGTYTVPVHNGQVAHVYYKKARKLCGLD